MGSSIAIIGFAIWPDLTRTQSLKYVIETHPTVLGYKEPKFNDSIYYIIMRDQKLFPLLLHDCTFQCLSQHGGSTAQGS